MAQRGPVPPALRDNVRPGYRSTSFEDSTGCQQASAVTRPLDMARQLAAVACGWSEGGSVTFCDGHTAHPLTLASAAGTSFQGVGKARPDRCSRASDATNFLIQLSVDTMIGFRMACDTPDRLLISCPTAGCCQGSLLSAIQITLCRTIADPFDAAITDLRNNPLLCHSAAPSVGSRTSFCRTMTAMPCSMAIVSRCISSSRRSWAAASAAAYAFCADASTCGD